MKTAAYELQKKAVQFRNELGLGPQEPIRFINIFLKLGIIAIFKDMSIKFSGMSIKIGDYKFILINSSHPVGRQNFTICHELYHLYLQEDFKSHTCNAGEFDNKDSSEYDADSFASFFLMPEDGIIEIIPEVELKKKNLISLPTLLKIEQFYGCSRSALLNRLDNLELIDKGKYEKYKLDVSKEAIKYGFDPYLYQPGNKNAVYGDYGQLAKKLFDNENISESHYTKLMRDIGIDIDTEIPNHDQS